MSVVGAVGSKTLKSWVAVKVPFVLPVLTITLTVPAASPVRILPLIVAIVAVAVSGIDQVNVGVVVVEKVRVAVKFRVAPATTSLALVISTP